MSKDSQMLCQRDSVAVEGAGDTETAGNTVGVTALLTSGVTGIFTTTATAAWVVCVKLTAKGNGVL
jgi:hypothetical protein